MIDLTSPIATGGAGTHGGVRALTSGPAWLRLAAAASFLGCVIGSAAVYSWSEEARVDAYHLLLVTSVGAGLLAAYYGTYLRPQRTLLFYFCCVYSAFHFGLAPVFLFPDLMAGVNQLFGLNWYSDFSGLARAHFISLVFLLGLLVAGLTPSRRRVTARVSPAAVNRPVYLASNMVLAVAIAAWLFLTFRTGGANYSDFVDNVATSGSGSIFGFVHGAIDAAFVLAVITGRPLVPYLLFLTWGTFAFTFGLRGEVAFPLLLSLCILVSQRRLSLPPWALAGGAAAFLALSAAVAVYRVSNDDLVELRPFSAARGLAELGGSLRPVYEAATWVDTDGFQDGATYFAPFERSFLRLFPIAPRLPGEEDERLTNVRMLRRLGPYGFSIAAEAYYNFGLLGTFAIGVLVGGLLLWCGNALASGRANAIAAALSVGLLDHIRQSFVNGYGTALSTLLVSVGILAIAKLLEERSLRAAAVST